MNIHCDMQITHLKSDFQSLVFECINIPVNVPKFVSMSKRPRNSFRLTLFFHLQ